MHLVAQPVSSLYVALAIFVVLAGFATLILQARRRTWRFTLRGRFVSRGKTMLVTGVFFVGLAFGIVTPASLLASSAGESELKYEANSVYGVYLSEPGRVVNDLWGQRYSQTTAYLNNEEFPVLIKWIGGNVVRIYDERGGEMRELGQLTR